DEREAKVGVLDVTRLPAGAGPVGDEALLHVRAIENGPAELAGAAVGPVDALGVDRHAVGAGCAGDEALVLVRAVKVGPANRVGGVVDPVDVTRGNSDGKSVV